MPSAAWSGPVVFIDADCVLCNRAARILAALDRRAVLRFVGLGGPTAARLLPPDTPGESMVLLHGGRTLTRSDAVIQCLVEVGGIWRAAHLFRVIPACFRNGIYDLVARWRIRLFGRSGVCRVPDPTLRSRFLADP